MGGGGEDRGEGGAFTSTISFNSYQHCDMPYHHPYFMDEESECQKKCLAQGDTRCVRDGILSKVL